MLPNRLLPGIVPEVMLPRIAPVFSIMAALAAAPSDQAALWVSPAGDDSGPGTEEQPLRTLEKARDVVRTLNRDMSDDITVFIAGDYNLERALDLGPEDSGTNGFNIVYTAAPGEHPVISGGRRVSGWSLADPARNLWSAPAPGGVDGAGSLFVNGTPADRTRGRMLPIFSKALAGGAAAAPDPGAQWKNPSDVLFEAPDPGSIWSEKSTDQAAFVVNAFELLGRPGEWYLDRAAHRFYYTPRAGEDMAKADAEAAVAAVLIRGAGIADHPISGLIFKGIRFECAAQPGAASRPGIDFRAAVSFAYAAGIQFLEDQFVHMGGAALDIGPPAEGFTVDGCVFSELSGSAIRVRGASGVRIEGSRFSYVATGRPDQGVIEAWQSKEVSIEHSQIDHFPRFAVLRREEPADAIREASNLVALPMIRYGGSSQAGGDAGPATGLGVPQAYAALLSEAFAAPSVPHPPAGVSAEGEDGFAYVTWIPCCLDGGSPVTSYTVASSEGAKIVVSPDGFQARGYVIFGGLDNGRAVSFTVSAANALGAGAPSLATAPVTPQRKRRLKAPQEPAAVSLTVGRDSPSVRITPPASDGGSPVVAYSVASVPAGKLLTIEGLDVIRAEPDHPAVRQLEELSLEGVSELAVSARNAEGAGKSLLVKVPR